MSEGILLKNDKGEFRGWIHISEYARQRFFGGVEQHISFSRVFWQHDLSTEAIWEFAQKHYKEVDKEFPGQLTLDDLEYYHPTNKR